MIIYLAKNVISYKRDKEEKHFIFKNKLSSLVLEGLWNKSLLNESLTFSELESLIKLNNPTFILQRTHISRVLAELDALFYELSLPLKIQYEKRNKTVGPWYLLKEQDIQLIYNTNNNEVQTFTERILNIAPSQNTSHIFCSFITQWFDSYSNYYLGFLNEALKSLEQCYQYPITLFTQSLLDLFRAKLNMLIGELDSAESIAEQINKNNKIPQDSYIKEQTHILQAKILYHRKPMSNYEYLLSIDFRPKKQCQEDILSLIEWHNVQSLLLKRKLLQHKSLTNIQALHHSIINHLQEAIIGSITIENNVLFVDICCNYALYLQTVQTMGLATELEILAWHQLSSRITDKLGIGDYSIWQQIFYAEFYLNNVEYFKHHKTENVEPSEERFYLNVIEKMENRPNKRLNLIFYLCYFKFLQENRLTKKLDTIANKINETLKHNQKLYLTLISDGYQTDIERVFQYINSSSNISKKIITTI